MPPRRSPDAGLPPELASIPRPRTFLGRAWLYHTATSRLRFPGFRLIAGALVLIVGLLMAGVLAGDAAGLSAFRAAPRCAAGVVDASCREYATVTRYEAAPGGPSGDYLIVMEVPSQPLEQQVEVAGRGAFVHAVQAASELQVQAWRGHVVTVTAGGLTEQAAWYPGPTLWEAGLLAGFEAAAWLLLRSAAKACLGRAIGRPVVPGACGRASSAITLATGALALAGTAVLYLGDLQAGWSLTGAAFAVMLLAVAVPVLIRRAR